MQVTPVKHYPEPDFPTYAILYEHPELLRLVPKRWRGNPLVLAALAGVCTILWGCRSMSRDDEPKGSSPKAKSHPVSLVAPIFQHGEGRGAFGCEVVNPPVFLSEEEARQVVCQEARKAGISFVEDRQSLPRISVPDTDRYGQIDYRDTEGSVGPRVPANVRKRISGPIPLMLDGTDKQRLISYEYVSQSDFNAWENQQGVASSVDEYDMRGTATALRDALVDSKPKGSFAVFYDPMVSTWQVAKERGTGPNEPVKDSRYELRKQVRDFIAWLKAQGVI